MWDTDDEDIEDLDLPDEIGIPEDIDPEDEEAISDYISDVTGFCHNGFAWIRSRCRSDKKIRRGGKNPSLRMRQKTLYQV